MLRPVLFDRESRPMFDSIFDDFFDNFELSNNKMMKTDIEDKGNSFVLEAELPGFKKEEISLEVDNGYLTIKAEHKEEKEEKDKKNKRNYIRHERSETSYVRRFNVSNVDTAHITAEYKNGVLEVNMPKLEATANDTKRIEVK